MAQTLNARHIFEVVRNNIDRIPFGGEVTDRSENVAESPSRTVADAFLLRQIRMAEHQLAADCKGLYLQDLTATYTGTLSSFDQSKMVRPLTGRVFRKDGSGDYQGCRVRKVAEHNYLKDAGRKATPADPAYTWDGGELRVYPNQNGSPDVKVEYIEVPSRISESSVPSDSNGDRPNAPAHVSGSDTLSVSDLLFGPIVMFVTAKAQRQLNRGGLHDLYMSLYQRLRQPYLRTWRFGTPDEYQNATRIDEREVNTEQ